MTAFGMRRSDQPTSSEAERAPSPTTATPVPQQTAPVKDIARTRILSAEQGTEYFIDHIALRERAVLIADPVGGSIQLVRSASHVMDSHVLTYEHKLKSLRTPYTTRNADVAEIARLWASVPKVETLGRDETRMQAQMLGYIRHAARRGASDLKLIINGNTCTIRELIHGRGYTRHTLPANEGRELAMALYNSMLDQAGVQLNDLAEQDGQLRPSFAHDAGLAGARVATRPAKNRGLMLTMRLLPHDGATHLTFESAGYLPQQKDDLLAMTECLQGVVVLSGKTGSGKTTLLKMCLEAVNDREDGEVDIITLEDPIEYDMQGMGIFQTPLVVNREDHDDIHRAWPRGIANLMRHAPKIIMPGEIRDVASAAAAFDFAMSGHGVWTTFHAFSAEGILLRLDEWGVRRELITNPALVIGLINQSLVRRLCPECKQPIKDHLDTLPAAFAQRVRKFTPIEGVYMKGPGCAACDHRGTAGRLVAAEVIVPDESFMRAYVDHGPLAARKHWAQNLNGMTKGAHVRAHITNGLVDPMHAERDVDHLDKDFRLLGVTR